VRARTPTLLAWIGLLALALVCATAAAQRRGAARRRPPRVIVLDELDCEMARWREPMLVPVVSIPACPAIALLTACGAATPVTGCPALEDATVATALDRCEPGRSALLALVGAAEAVGVARPLVPLLDRLAAAPDPDGEIDRVLLAELLRRAARYDAALSRFVALADGAADPALRALALERIVAIVEQDDWDEDGDVDADFASHFEPPRLPDRPWARDVAVRALPRVGCLQAHAVALGAIRRRFDFDPEGVIAIDHAQTLAGEAILRHLEESAARCRAEGAPCLARILDHAQNEARRGLYACGQLDASAEEHRAAHCQEGLALGRWVAAERPLAALEADLATASARLAWWTTDAARRGPPPPSVPLRTPRAGPAAIEPFGAVDPYAVRSLLSGLPLAACPAPVDAVLTLVEVGEDGAVRAVSNTAEPCVAAALRDTPRLAVGAEGASWQGAAVLVFPGAPAREPRR
jgi:hypothetical protein